MAMFTRWLTYQQEQFPVIKNGLLIAVFSVAAIGYSLVLRDGWTDRSPLHTVGLALIAFLSLFLFFLQLRIVDEFKALTFKASKSYKEDATDRIDRSSATGIVTLHDLQIIAIASGCIQFGLAWSVGIPLVLLLLLIWGYLGLLAKDFFIPTNLHSKPLFSLISHAAVTPLIAFYATAHDWLVAGTRPPVELLGFLTVSFFIIVVMRMGQKIRASKDEIRDGIRNDISDINLNPTVTSPRVWTRQQAVLVWLSAVWLIAISALLAATHIQFVIPIAFILLLLLTSSVVVAWRFLARPVAQWAGGIELMSELWAFLVYLGLGILPLLFQSRA